MNLPSHRTCGQRLVVALLLLGWLFATTKLGIAQDHSSPKFTTLVLTEEFHSEGVAVADIDGDGANDIVSGPFWYRGPGFRKRIAYADFREHHIKEYSEHFFSFTYDFDRDGDIDILSVPIPGRDAVWFENPKEHPSGRSTATTTRTHVAEQPNTLWTKHMALPSVGNESPTFVDLDGDKIPELVCIHNGDLGFASWNFDHPTAPWIFQAISKDQELGKFTHGLGTGDVDMDGRIDILESRGWWKQPVDNGQTWQFMAERFSRSGGSQIFAYDFDGDGDNDILSAQNAHGYGLSWFERRGAGNDFLFVEHEILPDRQTVEKLGLSISQLHAVDLADLDGDGVKDVVTGKRFFAHGGNDPGAFELPLLVWFKTTRHSSDAPANSTTVDFVPHVVHERSGVGTQITLTDVDQDGTNDIVTANKLGTFVALNSPSTGSSPGRGTSDSDTQVPRVHEPLVSDSKSRIGTDAFAVNVRTTEAQTPESEQQSFVLPDGFEAQLVASEPQIAKPMNMAFDARGRLWVTSSVEYPHPKAEGQVGRDTLKILEDEDGDGFAENVTTFADGLNIPMGVYPYLDGAICFSIPNILFLRDLDGDGKCDRRDVLYGPMDTTRDTHGMCNAFTRGFDGWLYACHGFNNQTTVQGGDGHEVVMHSGNTFRMRLDGSRIEHFTHGQVNPFGLAFRANGDLFSADCHTRPVSLLLQGGYYPSFGKPHDGLGFVPDVMRHLHGSTGIGGIAIYDAPQFPKEYRSSSYGGNVMTGRINRNSLHQIGSSVEAREEPDFLISGDPWFRPVDLQIGPDGALYVADFYNRIIGHYEVDLNHPGRDRYRGRIWKIVYKGTDRRRDNSPNTPKEIHTTSQKMESTGGDNELDQWITQLTSRNLSVRMRAADQIVDRFSKDAEQPVRKLLKSTDENELVHAIWILARIGGLETADIDVFVKSPNASVREHLLRILGEYSQRKSNEFFRDNGPSDSQLKHWLLQGLQDEAPLVQRAAALASRHTADPAIALLLLDTTEHTHTPDVHLHYAFRMALRDQLLNPNVFSEVARWAEERPQSRQLLTSMCRALRTEQAGEYLSQHLSDLKNLSDESLQDTLRFALRFAPEDRIASIIEFTQTRFVRDLDGQSQLLSTLSAGLRSRFPSGEFPAPINAWAANLSKEYLREFYSGEEPVSIAAAISWQSLSLAGNATDSICWQRSKRRASHDGTPNVPLYSSFPSGEQRTGIYRSSQFALPERFSLLIAGHDGFPQNPPSGKNKVRIRDAKTHQVLHSWSPPRNDVAQSRLWHPQEHAGKQVYIELVDGDDANAYAWLAVGGFNVAVLNPSDRTNRWSQAAAIIGEYRLTEFIPILEQILRASGQSAKMQSVAAQALSAFSSSALHRSIAVALDAPLLPEALRLAMVSEFARSINDEAVSTTNSPRILDLLGQWMSIASYERQRSLAEILSSDAAGAAALIEFAEKGKASRRLLSEPSIAPKLAALADKDQVRRLSALQSNLPQEDEQKLELLAQRLSQLTSSLGNPTRGQQVFSKNCAVCHQVAGQGEQVGPNLDGIGNRGLKRLIEDVGLPNRNIDQAFLSSVVLTEDGKVLRGLARHEQDGILTLIDFQGKKTEISENTIEQLSLSQTSPMPDNFLETLSEQQTRDLFGYLMSLRN